MRDTFKNHGSIQRIKIANFHCNEVFNFRYAKEEEECLRFNITLKLKLTNFVLTNFARPATLLKKRL